MKEFFYSLWTDEAKFVGVCRGVAFAVAGALQTGLVKVPGLDGWVGALLPWVLSGGAVAVPAGQRNVKHFVVSK